MSVPKLCWRWLTAETVAHDPGHPRTFYYLWTHKPVWDKAACSWRKTDPDIRQRVFWLHPSQVKAYCGRFLRPGDIAPVLPRKRKMSDERAD